MRTLYEFYFECMGPHPDKIHIDYEEHPEDEGNMLKGWAEICRERAKNYIAEHWKLPGWQHHDNTPFMFKHMMLDLNIHEFVFPYYDINETERFRVTDEETLEILRPNNTKVVEEKKTGEAAE